MDTIKKILGIVWIVLGPVLLFFLIRTGLGEIAKAEAAHKSVLDAKVQWGVFVIVFVPIVVGFVLFGYYALMGEYATGTHIPDNNG